MESYDIAVRGCTKHAVETVVVKLIRGEVQGVSKTFAPSPAELSSAIRDEMQAVERQVALAEERQQLEDKRPVAAPVKLVQDRVDEAKAMVERERRRLLFPVTSHEAFVSRRREMPVGSTFIAILSGVYGPPGSADDPPPAEQAAPTDADIEF